MEHLRPAGVPTFVDSFFQVPCMHNYFRFSYYPLWNVLGNGECSLWLSEDSKLMAVPPLLLLVGTRLASTLHSVSGHDFKLSMSMISFLFAKLKNQLVSLLFVGDGGLTNTKDALDEDRIRIR